MNMLLILYMGKKEKSHDVIKVNYFMDSQGKKYNLSNPMEDKYIKFCHIYIL